MRYFVAVLVVVLALAVVTSDSYAQAVGAGMPKRELLLFEDIPIVTSVARRPQPITEANAAITVITAEEIEAMNPENLWDIFRKVPGVDVMTQDGRTGNVSPRGFNQDMARLNQVLIDGRSVYSPIYGGTNWDALPLFYEDIERIEVIRGPHILYGSNAFTGIINIITKKPSDTTGGMVKTTFGSHDFARGVVRYGETGENTDYRVSLGSHYDRGYGPSSGKEVNDWERDQSINTRVEHRLSGDATLEFLAGLKLDHGRPNTVNIGSSVKGGDLYRDYQMLQYNKNLGDGSAFLLRFYRNEEVENKHAQGSAALGRLVADTTDSEYRTYDIEAQHNFAWFNDAINTVWGGEVRYNSGHLYILGPEGNHHIDQIYRLFVNHDYKIRDDITVSIGAAGEHNRYTSGDISTREAILYVPRENQTVRLSHTRTFRIPGMVEDAQNLNVGVLVLGNNALQREEVNAYELGYSSRFLNNRFTFGADVYHNEYKDLIESYLKTAPVTYSFRNTNDAIARGVELHGDYKVNKALDIYSNYTLQKIQDKSQFISGSEPRHKFNFGIEALDEKVNMRYNLDLHYVGSVISTDIDDNTSLVTKIPQYTRVDASVTKFLWGGDMEVSLVGKNLVQNRHYEFIGTSASARYPVSIERTFYIVTKAKF